MGAIPPFATLSLGLGKTLLLSIMLISPNPRQQGQYPLGELNEKLCGAGSL